MKIQFYKKLLMVAVMTFAVPMMQVNAEDIHTRYDTFVGEYNKVFANAFRQYSGLSQNKAFALAVDANRSWAYGLGNNYADQNEANRRALFECNARIKKYQVKAPCKLYAVNAKIVW